MDNNSSNCDSVPELELEGFVSIDSSFSTDFAFSPASGLPDRLLRKQLRDAFENNSLASKSD